MSWFQRLYETYENCQKASKEDSYEIAPPAHTHKTINIEVTLNENSEMIAAEKIHEDTIIPTSDDNNCRWGLAVNIKTYKKGEEIARKQEALKREAEKTYQNQLKEWCRFDPNNEKIKIINRYIEKNTLIEDLKANGILKYNDNDFIRWIVGHDKERRTWENEAIINSWIKFRRNDLPQGLCYVTGNNESCIIKKHPFANGSAKLISAEDDKNFVFNGRFSNQSEVVCIDFEVSQKAHNVLQWLTSEKRKQAYRNYPQVIVAFNVHGQNGNVGRIFSENLSKSISGYNVNIKPDIKPDENIIILEMNAASKGRACITYYREILGSKYLENIQNWHRKYEWEQYLDVNNKKGSSEYKYLIGTPAIDTLATAYFYKNKREINKNEKKIKQRIIRDLIPSVIENRNIPSYIEEQFIRKASNPIALNTKLKLWDTILRIACCVYKGNKYGEGYKMCVNEGIKDRSYLYGRLLAVIDYAEWCVLRIKATDSDDIRLTNAQRFMRQFSTRPADTWKMLYEKFETAYRCKLKNDYVENLATDIVVLNPEELKNNSPLSPDYLLGYFCQRKLLREKKDKK